MFKTGRLRVQNKVAFIIVTLLIVVLIVLVVVFFWLYNNAKNSDADTDQTETSQRILQKVSELYLVPTEEEPTIATIQNKDKLKDQSFFDQARNGDYVVVYAKAKVALLYRESIDKLVNVGPVNPQK